MPARRQQLVSSRTLGLLIPATAMIVGVSVARTQGGASLLTAATVATPVLAAGAGWVRGWRLPVLPALVVPPLYLLAWLRPGALPGEAAARRTHRRAHVHRHRNHRGARTARLAHNGTCAARRARRRPRLGKPPGHTGDASALGRNAPDTRTRRDPRCPHFSRSTSARSRWDARSRRTPGTVPACSSSPRPRRRRDRARRRRLGAPAARHLPDRRDATGPGRARRRRPAATRKPAAATRWTVRRSCARAGIRSSSRAHHVRGRWRLHRAGARAFSGLPSTVPPARAPGLVRPGSARPGWGG